MAKTFKHIAVLGEDKHSFLTGLKIRKNMTFEASFCCRFEEAMTYDFYNLEDNGGSSNMTTDDLQKIADIVGGTLVVAEMEVEFKFLDGEPVEIKEHQEKKFPDSFAELLRAITED